MAVTISAEQRDAIYDRVLDRLSGIGDIFIAADSGDFETADRLAREYSDELRLVSDSLGWGPKSASETIEMEAPPELLRRVFERLREVGASEREAQASGWAEARSLEKRNLLVDEACATVLNVVGEGS